MRIGIVGGTFNPPHRGHLALAQTVLDAGLVDRAILIPASMPPHKAAPSESSADRLVMTTLLAGEDARLSVDDIELERSGPSYTIDTVRQLQAMCEGDTFRLVIGSDMAKSFGLWRSCRELLTLAPPLVAERPDSLFASPAESPVPLFDFPHMSPEEASIVWQGRFPMEPVDISSTMVRDCVASGADDAILLAYITCPILDYIKIKRLYCS